jgi:hypothetical protein
LWAVGIIHAAFLAGIRVAHLFVYAFFITSAWLPTRVFADISLDAHPRTVGIILAVLLAGVLVTLLLSHTIFI